MRRLLSLLFLAALAVGVWLGGRWLVHRGEVKATIVFRDPHGIQRGDPVVENGAVVGRVIGVDRLDDRTAVTVRLSRDHRRAIVTDSMFAIDHQSVVVMNTFAIGAPVADGAILTAHEDRVTSWLAKHAGAVKPYLDAARAKADQAIDRTNLKEKVNQWLDEAKKK